MTGVVPSSDNANGSLKLTIRLSSSARFEIGACGTITPSSTVRQVKDLIAQREESGHCAVERQRLIYKGRILSEETRTLAFYGIEGGHVAGVDGIVLYLVKGGGGATGGNANSGSGNIATAATATTTSSSFPVFNSSQPNPNANLNSNPFLNFGNANNSTSSNPMANMMNSMMGGGGMPDLASFQQQLQQNPQMMSEMMNNPMVQSLMNSPDFLRSMMESNPQMRQVMDSNPELRHALEDPEFMRRSMEMMRDPSAMQNMMRNQDLAMSQIENMPGGYNALRRMYEDVQEPMMDAMMSGGSRGNYSSSSSSSGGGNNGGQGRAGTGAAGATNQAMPNPWGAPAPSTSSLSTSQVAGGTNPFASLVGNMGSIGMPGAGGGAGNNPWVNPAMGPNGPNLEATLQMMENPMMQQMMQNMMNNPETMRMMMESNPMLQQLRQTNPQVAAIFENPQAVRAMMDPNNLRAMMQMQQAMEQLNGSMSGIAGMPPMGSGRVTGPPAGGLDFSNLLGSSGNASSTGTSGAAPMANPFMFPFMPPVSGGNQPAGGSATQPAPGQRFRQQLNSLQDMGFTDRSANIRALTSSHGNINRAIEILLESPPEMGHVSDSAGADPAASESNAEEVVSQSTNDNEPDEQSVAKGSTEKKND